MPKKAGTVVIDISAGTAKFIADMDSANVKLKQFGAGAATAGHGAASSMQAASGAVRIFEGNITNNVRAVERFLTGTLKLGPILQAAFPLIGALAFAGLIGKIGVEVYNFFKKVEQGPARIANAFRDLNAPLKLTNDELARSNDQLANDIAKLEGKRQNTLQIALDDARIAADKLAESLHKDLDALNKLLKEEEIGFFKSFVSGARTDDLRKELGGATGHGGFAGTIDTITDEGNAKIDAATTLKEKDAAQLALNIRLTEAYDRELGKLNQRLDDAQRKAGKGQAPSYQAYVKNPALYAPWGAQAGQGDETVNIEETQGAIRSLTAQRRNIALTATHETLTDRKSADEAANANLALERPLKDKLAALDAQITVAASRLGGAGRSEADKEMLAANAAAVKSIEELNKALEHQHGKLDAAGEAAIRLREKSIVVLTAEAEWKTKLAATTAALEDRIAAQKLLTAAIGAGYEATRKAAVEFQVRQEVGHEHFNDPEWMKAHAADVAKIQQGTEGEFDEKHATQVAEAVYKLNDQIELEKSLAAVQVKGAEAVRLVTLAYKLRELAHKGDNAEIAKEIALYNETRKNVNAKTLEEINLEIAATGRLSAAQIEGAESVRRAQLELKYEAMKREDSTPAGLANIAATRQEDELKHQQAITEEVLKSANADRDRLQAIDAEIKAAVLLQGTGADQLGIMIKLRDLDNERLAIQARQILQTGTLRDGMRAFFLDMEQSAKSSGEIIYQALHSAFDQVSHNLAQLVTKGKTDFGAMFKSIGRQMVESTIKSSLQSGLGALGKSLGIHVAAVHKPTGNPGDPVHVLVDNQGQGGPGSVKPGSGGGSGATGGSSPFPSGKFGNVFGGSAGGGIFNFGGSPFGGAFAGGGDMSADSAYIVGEEGPEILDKTAGRIISNSKSKRLLSGGGAAQHFYTIDARGTDPVLTEQRVQRAIVAAHNSAVSNSVVANNERANRTPVRF